MLETLKKLYYSQELIEMIKSPELWTSLDIDYDKPRVQRLWTHWDGYRVYLHRIHTCEEAMMHPHPWPSVVHVLSGGYEMGVGYGAGESEPPVAATMIMTPGSMYEMMNVDGWHYVKPYFLTHTIMLSGIPWKRPHVKKAAYQLRELDPETKKDMLKTFHRLVR